MLANFALQAARMRIEIEPGVRLYIDVEGTRLVPDGPTPREKPALVLPHSGPGCDHSTRRRGIRTAARARSTASSSSDPGQAPGRCESHNGPP